MNPGVASWIPLARRAEDLGDAHLGTVLILGATGMAGSIAVDNAYALGARAVVAVGRNQDQLTALRERSAGHDLQTVALGEGVDVSGEIVTALDGRPPSTVIDFLWGPVADETLLALGRPELDSDGYDVSYVQVGSMAGADATVPAALLRSRTIRLSGSGLGGTPLHELMGRLPQFLAQIAAGRVHVPYVAYPLARAVEAWSAGGHPRVVLVPG